MQTLQSNYANIPNNTATNLNNENSEDNNNEHNDQTKEWVVNRWTRISDRAQDKNFVFNNLLTHINVTFKVKKSPDKLFNGLKGSSIVSGMYH